MQNPSLEEKIAVLEHTRSEMSALRELAALIEWEDVAKTISTAISQAENQMIVLKKIGVAAG